MRYLLFSILILAGQQVAASSLELANARSYFLDFAGAESIDGCEPRLRLALQQNLIRIIPAQEQADALYRVRIELGKSSGFRHSLSWVADAYSAEKQLLFAAEGKESGWTLQAACLDAADDIAEALRDEVASARVNRATLPLPKYPENHQPRAGLVKEDEPAVDPSYQIKERAINQQAPPGFISSHRWETHARSFARTRGCSSSLEHVQSLETGTESYTTVCGDSGEALITCAAGDCVLSF